MYLCLPPISLFELELARQNYNKEQYSQTFPCLYVPWPKLKFPDFSLTLKIGFLWLFPQIVGALSDE